MSNVRNRAASYQTLASFNAESRSDPSSTVRGMYQQEQQIAKAEGAGLIVTAKDLEDEEPINIACVHCAYVTDHICDECEANE